MGTLGRAIADGVKEVNIFGETSRVEAEISILAGVSGHGDRAGLMRWLNGFHSVPKHVFVVHGEDESCTQFAAFVKEQFGFESDAPYSGSVYDLAAGRYERIAEPVPILREKKGAKAAEEVFAHLQMLGRRLLELIASYKGRANRDIRAFSKDLEEICKKYEDQ